MTIRFLRGNRSNLSERPCIIRLSLEVVRAHAVVHLPGMQRESQIREGSQTWPSLRMSVLQRGVHATRCDNCLQG